MQTSLMDSIPSLNRSGVSGIGQDAGTEGTCMLHEQKALCTALSLTTPYLRLYSWGVPCLPGLQLVLHDVLPLVSLMDRLW